MDKSSVAWQNVKLAWEDKWSVKPGTYLNMQNN